MKDSTLLECDAVSLKFRHVSKGHVSLIVEGNSSSVRDNDPEETEPRPKRLVTGHSLRRPGFENRPVHVTAVNGVPRGAAFSPSTFVLPCQYHSTIAPYSFIHLPPTLYNVFLPILQFSPVCIIPPLLHTHSFIYHPRCIMFFSQYFSFPLSVSFHHRSILIHLPPTLYNVFLLVLQFYPVSFIPSILDTHLHLQAALI